MTEAQDSWHPQEASGTEGWRGWPGPHSYLIAEPGEEPGLPGPSPHPSTKHLPAPATTHVSRTLEDECMFTLHAKLQFLKNSAINHSFPYQRPSSKQRSQNPYKQVIACPSRSKVDPVQSQTTNKIYSKLQKCWVWKVQFCSKLRGILSRKPGIVKQACNFL